MVDIKITGNTITDTKIYINDVLVEGVSRYELSQKAGQLSELHLTIPANEIEINTESVLILPEIYREHYILKEKVETLADESTFE